MYEQFYQLADKPFRLTTDARDLYPSQSHTRALELLAPAVGGRRGHGVVTGEAGTGKTVLCRALVAQLDPKCFTGVLFTPPASEDELVMAMLSELGVLSADEIAASGQHPDWRQLAQTLRDFFRSLTPLGATAVLILDDAHACSPATLRAILSILPGYEMALQVLLVGQPELVERLRAPELQALDEKLSLRCQLGPLAEHETTAYIEQRLATSDGSPAVTFAPAALQMVHRRSGGTPRLINLICHHALRRGFLVQAERIETAMVAAAVEDLAAVPPPTERRSWLGRFRREKP